MGGHTRRSKHSSKSSSTVICDSAASLEDWKQQIKAKGNIPANQQRLIFTSQRLIKQPVPLASFIPSRQWTIIVDASIEEIWSDLRHWRAILHSENTSGELLQPLVLKETDELASVLHSRTAKELRDIGVGCNVFFLSFDKWIPTLESGIVEEHNSPNDLRGLDLKVDEEFCQNIFLIELFGDLNGLCLPMPLCYVMSGSELTSKLFMVKQTAQYREEQKQRYHQFSTPALKDSEADSAQGSIEVNRLTYGPKNYVLEFDQNCEFTTFISRDNHRLRCIVLPVITISLAEARGGEKHFSSLLSRADLKEAIGERTSRVLALPSTSAEASPSTASNVVEEVPQCATSESPAGKSAKKKKKRKAKKAAKENNKLLTEAVAVGNEATTSDPQFPWATTEVLQGEVATEDASTHRDVIDLEQSCDITETSVKSELQCVPISELEHEDSGCTYSIRGNHFSQKETEELNAANQSSLVCNATAGSGQKQCPWLTSDNTGSNHDNVSTHLGRQEIPTHGPVLEHYDQAINPSKVQEDILSTSKNCESVKVDDALMNTETPANFSTGTAKGMGDFLGQGKVKSAQHSLNKTEGSKKFKDSFDNMQRAETQNVSQNEWVADNMMSSRILQNGRWEHTNIYPNLNRNGSWTHRPPSDGQDNFFHRSRMNQNSSLNGDSRSSVPTWRHRKHGLNYDSQSWSRPRLSGPDNWPADGGFSPGSRQPRNIPVWEQLPNLRQPSMSQLDDSWPSGQNYSSFNMQQRKSGKSNKISQRYLDKRQFQSMPNDVVSTNMKAGNVWPHEPYVNSVRSSMKAGSDGTGADLRSKGEIAQAPLAHSASTVIMSSLQNDRLPAECEKSGLESSKPEVVEHVHTILEAVSASIKTLNVYEQNLTGKALSEFEKVAKAVAPAIKASTTLRCWEQTKCSCDSLATGFTKSDNSVRVPDAALSTFWQWYEEPSCYGLKVKLSACSERTDNELQAFFVPYLSGIQVFGWPKRRTSDNKETMATQVGSSSPFDSGFLSQPIFSILLPRPEKSNDSTNSEGRHLQAGLQEKASNSELGAISGNQGHCHCGVELLYEFFEVEKPQQRKSLTNRIKELVSKDADAHVLISTKLEDLHPSSWFAVAWYPIYTIPDETFRSAFLTYHCLGCLQSDSSELTSSIHYMDMCMNTVTAPVVGLMSYNAQVKDWFSLTPPCDVNLSDKFQQYLAKLETAAASMARGTCDPSSSFKQADFTFFQSRGR